MIVTKNIGLLTSLCIGILLSIETTQGVSAQQASISLGSTISDPTKKNKKRKKIWEMGADAAIINEQNESEDTEILVEEEEPSALKQCELGFEGVKMILQQKKGKPDRVILDGSLKGVAKPGRMLGIMGPSGSGKSTLIHALAGRIQESKKIQVFGKRYINGELLADDSTLPVAFIEQDVNFFPHMTVKETLDFRIELKLGSKLGKSARDDVASDLMDLLGLTKSANTIVGSTKVRGLSGGERKRLSIACELISSPPIIILDEPTSGLDSYQAAQVVETLRKLADSGKTVIAVIHQPSQSIFNMFDDLLLMSEGKLMYFGERSRVRSHFKELGYPCASDTGTAEHVLDVISRANGGSSDCDKRLGKISEASRSLVEKIELTPAETRISSDVVKHLGSHHKLKIVCDQRKSPSAGILKQFKLLLSRAFKETIRGKAAMIIKLVQQITLGVVYGGIYRVGKDQASVMDRFGLVSLIAIGSMNMAVASTTRAFTREKSVVSGEMSGGMYRTLPYFLAKAISEIPVTTALNGVFGAIIYPLTHLQERKFKNFLWLTTVHTLACQAVGLFIGAVSPNTDVAMSLFPPLVVLNVIFDGRNISEENTPFLFKWFPKVSLVRWAFEGLSVNEFDGLTFDTSGPRRGPLIRTGAEALERFGFEKRTTGQVVSAQRNIIAGCWALAFLGLSLTKTKFEHMTAP